MGVLRLDQTRLRTAEVLRVITNALQTIPNALRLIPHTFRSGFRLGGYLCIYLCASQAVACPEMIIPVDPEDSALKSRAWKKGLEQWRKGRYKRADRTLRKAERRLAREIQKLFHPQTTDDAAPNRRIQTWLQRYVYTERPSILISGHRFTFPALVWWALADTTCRQGRYTESVFALTRLRELRDGRDVAQHRALVLLHLGKYEQAEKLVQKLPPDGFLTPYMDGWLAAAKGDNPAAKQLLQRAQAGAALASQRDALDRLWARYAL